MISFLNDSLFLIPWPWPLIINVSAMGLLALTAFAKKSLSPSGAAAAFIVGVITLQTVRFEGFLLFLLFFVSCNVVGKVSGRIQSITTQRKIEKKGSCRDAMQVLANGLMAVLAALLWQFSAKQSAIIMFGAAIAEATSDTFAGEIGRLSKKAPVSILTRRPVEKGLSGGVTVLGTFAAFFSSLAIAICWLLWFKASIAQAAIVCLLGFCGAILDSFLGAFAQAQYKDPESGKITEHEEINGQKLELVRGIRWIDNDMVNLMSNVFSAVFALGMSALVL